MSLLSRRILMAPPGGSHMLRSRYASRASAFTPANLGSTLKAWLNARVGVTQAATLVSAWADQSGNGANVAQATDAAKFVYKASAINGLPGMTSAAGTFMENTVANLMSSTSPRTIFVVCKASSATGGWMFQCRRTAPGFQCGLFQVGDTYAYNSASAAIAHLSGPPAISGVPLIFELAYAGGNVPPTVKINGTSYSLVFDSGAGAENDSGATGFVLGDTLNGTRNFIGDLCEYVVCDTLLSADDRTSVRGYLSSTYAIAVA